MHLKTFYLKRQSLTWMIYRLKLLTIAYSSKWEEEEEERRLNPDTDVSLHQPCAKREAHGDFQQCRKLDPKSLGFNCKSLKRQNTLFFCSLLRNWFLKVFEPGWLCGCDLSPAEPGSRGPTASHEAGSPGAVRTPSCNCKLLRALSWRPRRRTANTWQKLLSFSC